MGGDGQPLFYLTARSDDREDSAADAVSGAEHLYICLLYTSDAADE